jgi:DNA polymerase III epsilon subunit family exonuclease
MHHKKISQTTFSFMDTETTALCPSQYGRVCEIAVIKISPRGERQCFSHLINPKVPIAKNAIAVHGITDEMVKSKPSFEELVPQIMALICDSVLVFHNKAFDIPFLVYEFANAGFRFAPPVVLDTLQYARRHGRFKSNSLGQVAAALGISNSGWHRAMADAEMTEKIFFHFLKKFQSAGIETLAELEKLQIKKIGSIA